MAKKTAGIIYTGIGVLAVAGTVMYGYDRHKKGLPFFPWMKRKGKSMKLGAGVDVKGAMDAMRPGSSSPDTGDGQPRPANEDGPVIAGQPQSMQQKKTYTIDRVSILPNNVFQVYLQERPTLGSIKQGNRVAISGDTEISGSVPVVGIWTDAAGKLGAIVVNGTQDLMKMNSLRSKLQQNPWRMKGKTVTCCM